MFIIRENNKIYFDTPHKIHGRVIKYKLLANMDKKNYRYLYDLLQLNKYTHPSPNPYNNK